jgi:hypothetical protein
MTDEQINKAIAMTCGWKFIPEYCHGEDQPPEFTTVTPDGKHLCGYYPDYCQDLNAMHIAEMMLSYVQAAEYARILTSIALQSEQPFFALMTSTASQRAEAFLRTLNLWTE